MNDAPPPLTPSSSNPYQPQQYQQAPPAGTPNSGSGKKWLFGCGCGCLGLILILSIGGYFAYIKIQEVAATAIAEYTATESVAVEIPQLSQDQIDQSVEKFSAFQAGLADGTEPVTLVLSGQDINALIQSHPTFKPLADRASVTVEEDRLRSQVSLSLEELDIPIPFIAEAVKGKYFNGIATFSVGMTAGRPALYIEGLEVNDAAIPAEFMSEISKQNFLEDAGKDPEFAKLIEMIEDIRIENGELRIVPKAAP
ncbi:MAG: hypothetical protein NWR21_07155 [Verrucomicrobiales bacterium]|jgi:hypothetical protein|nr:hypothetical protein [Verrucomicrobiales bacterium]MDP4790764.1 hypothetical protein [Verrucomicrobiales bacterium]MDP4939072.1 hypothetical protein [Verrucomicrobiales bacterium]MDP5005284.1 hypothetical protein [Verrucomicrobiales bacterium]